MGSVNKNQHFVPQYYLKNFTDKGRLHILDRNTQRQFTNSVKEVAYRKYFYNVRLDLLNKLVKNKKITSSHAVDDIIRISNEERLSVFINSFNQTAERLENGDHRQTVSIIDKHSLTDFALVQLYRTSKYSILARKVQKKLESMDARYKRVSNESTVRGMNLLSLLSVLHTKIPIEWQDEVADMLKPLVSEYQVLKSDIDNSLMIMYMSGISRYFITSDSPVGIKWNFDSALSTFSVMSIPINQRVAFLLVNRKLFPQLAEVPSFNKLIIEKNKQDLININLLTTYSAERFLFGSTNDFSNELDFINGKTNLRLELDLTNFDYL